LFSVSTASSSIFLSRQPKVNGNTCHAHIQKKQCVEHLCHEKSGAGQTTLTGSGTLNTVRRENLIKLLLLVNFDFEQRKKANDNLFDTPAKSLKQLKFHD